jgi:hypothetical protein
MVAGVEYRPANRTVLKYEIASLSRPERDLARRLADEAAVAGTPDFMDLPADRRRAVAKVAYGYLRFRAVGEPRSAATAQRGLDLLGLVNATARAGEMPSEPPRPAAPEDGHRSGLLAFGAGTQEADAFADFEWRLSYHDLLDGPVGYPEGSSLNMGRFVMRLEEGGNLRLQRFDALEITSLSPRDGFFRPWSWRVNTGLDRQWTGGEDVLVPQVNAGFGWTIAPARGFAAFGLLTGRVEYNHEMERELDIAPGMSAGATLDSAIGMSLVSFDYSHFTGGVDRRRYGIGHNVPLRRNLAVRMNFERSEAGGDRVNEAGIALRYHF